MFDTDNGTAIPIANTLNILGTSVPAGSTPVETTGAGNTVTVEVQTSQAIVATDANAIGLAAFDSSQFSVDANGFVSIIGGSNLDSIGVDDSTFPGTNPVLPDGAGLINIFGATVANHLIPIETHSRAANELNIEVQYASSAAASNIALNGLAHFDNTQFTVGIGGFVSLSGGGSAIDSIGVQATSGTGTDPVLPDGAGLVEFEGALIAAGTNPLRAVSTAINTVQYQVQTSQALAAADSTKTGLSNFDSTSFAVAATGFVTLSTTGAGKTITGDTGGALSPTANNWFILGLAGSKTSGSGSTLTVKSPPYADQGGSTSVTLNSGSFATAAITLTTPVTAGLADGDLLEFVATNGVLVIQLAATQVGHLGSMATSVAGNFTGTATGDSLSIRYQASTNDWWATSSIGTWVLA